MKQALKILRLILFVCVVACIWGAPLPGVSAETLPNPQQLLQVARLASSSQQVQVRGQLRSGGRLSPFQLEVNHGRLRFAFQQPERVFEVRLGDDESGVYDAKGRRLIKGMNEPVTPEAEVTVEDLSLGFLYWPDARLLGHESVRSRPAWKIELRPQRGGTEFAVVRLWLDVESGALLRIEGFDGLGRLARRFEVVSGQRIDGQWMLKQMRIEKFMPDSSTRPVGRSYLEILGKPQAEG